MKNTSTILIEIGSIKLTSTPKAHFEMKSFSSPHGKTPQPSKWFSTFFFLSFLIFVGILYSEDFSCILGQPFQQEVNDEHNQDKDAELPFSIGKKSQTCNIFDGKWVYDEVSRPQYREQDCPHIQPQLTCQEHRRPEHMYQHWRWQPHGCSLPSFNASFMLEALRGRRVLFVGDSLNRGQFTSLVCLLHQALPYKHTRSIKSKGSFFVFSIQEYNATVEFYWAPFLVESNSDNPRVHRVKDRIVRAESIMKHAKHWKGAHIIVFNTYLWWMGGKKNFQILRGSFKGDMKDITTLSKEDAYRLAFRRVLRWVERNMDPENSRVFFSNMAPTHQSATWSGEPDGNCYNQTQPIEPEEYRGLSIYKPIMRTINEELERAKFPITLLNITQLSDYRKDAHTSIYKKQWTKLTPEQLADPKSYADCIHWCLPGLQDTWNELLYTKLFFP